MIDVGLFLLLAVVLFLIRKFIQVRIQGLVMLMGGSTYQGVLFYSVMFLPGIIIHELAHFFTAAILGVRTGDIAIFPNKIGEDNRRVALGSVKVAKTDFIRGSLIGAAPFFAGCIVIFSLVRIFFLPNAHELTQINVTESLSMFFSLSASMVNWLWLILLFVVGNTMFSSKEDARTFPILLILMIPVAILGYRYHTSPHFLKAWGLVVVMIKSLQVSFLFVIVLNLLVSGFLLLNERVLEKVLKKKVVYKRR